VLAPVVIRTNSRPALDALCCGQRGVRADCGVAAPAKGERRSACCGPARRRANAVRGPHGARSPGAASRGPGPRPGRASGARSATGPGRRPPWSPSTPSGATGASSSGAGSGGPCAPPRTDCGASSWRDEPAGGVPRCSASDRRRCCAGTGRGSAWSGAPGQPPRPGARRCRRRPSRRSGAWRRGSGGGAPRGSAGNCANAASGWASARSGATCARCDRRRPSAAGRRGPPSLATTPARPGPATSSRSWTAGAAHASRASSSNSARAGSSTWASRATPRMPGWVSSCARPRPSGRARGS